MKMYSPLTQEEKRAIATLKRLEKTWPPTLWLYSASGRLNVMKTNSDGKRAYSGGPDDDEYTDQNYRVTGIKIANDGERLLTLRFLRALCLRYPIVAGGKIGPLTGMAVEKVKEQGNASRN